MPAAGMWPARIASAIRPFDGAMLDCATEPLPRWSVTASNQTFTGRLVVEPAGSIRRHASPNKNAIRRGWRFYLVAASTTYRLESGVNTRSTRM